MCLTKQNKKCFVFKEGRGVVVEDEETDEAAVPFIFH